MRGVCVTVNCGVLFSEGIYSLGHRDAQTDLAVPAKTGEFWTHSRYGTHGLFSVPCRDPCYHHGTGTPTQRVLNVSFVLARMVMPNFVVKVTATRDKIIWQKLSFPNKREGDTQESEQPLHTMDTFSLRTTFSERKNDAM